MGKESWSEWACRMFLPKFYDHYEEYTGRLRRLLENSEYELRIARKNLALQVEVAQMHANASNERDEALALLRRGYDVALYCHKRYGLGVAGVQFMKDVRALLDRHEETGSE